MNEHHNPWQIIDEQKVYNNNWITVTHYNVINPSGNKGIYGKVHMKNVAIGIVPLDGELNTYIVGQYRFVLNEYSWEIPEGGGPLGTTRAGRGARHRRAGPDLCGVAARVVGL